MKKNKKKQKKTSVNHFDLFGRRDAKYNFLNSNSINTINWNSVDYDDKNSFFTSKDLLTSNEYLNYIQITNLIPLYNSGIQTKCDSISINESVEKLKKIVETFKKEPVDILKTLFDRKESSGWNFNNAKNDLINNNSIVYTKYNYRPFDFRHIVYTGTSSGFIGRSRSKVMKHFIKKNNIGLCLMRQFFQDAPYSHIYITNTLIDERTMYSNRGGTYLFPIYLYPDQDDKNVFSQESLTENGRKPNLNMEIVNQIAEKIGLQFTPEKEETEGTFAPIDILDYIYAVLHSPTYREKYKEFLKIDFPRVPYPKDKNTFWKLVKLGSELRQIHLLESSKVENFITSYPIDGDNKITTKISKKDWQIIDEEKQLGRIWINEKQYFDKIPVVAWNFYIGGYQPTQKWLKDRRGRTLNFEDILHYQKIIVALTETDRIMKEIDKIEII